MVAWITGDALSTVLMIGKPRTPITPGQAVFSILICALLIVGMVTL